jgi:hypothetical protein
MHLQNSWLVERLLLAAVLVDKLGVVSRAPELWAQKSPARAGTARQTG